MRKNIIYSLVGLALLLGTYACSDDDKYSTSVVNQIELFLDDEPWAVNTGLSTKPHLTLYFHQMHINLVLEGK